MANMRSVPGSQVAVVGAGVAGLAAAASLSQAGFEVVLLEAANYIGGRLKQVQPFDGFPPIDLGGEFIHGSHSILNKLAKENCWIIKPGYAVYQEDVMVYLNGQLYPLESNQPDVLAAINAWEMITSIRAKKCHEEQGKAQIATNDFMKGRLVEQQLSRDAQDVFESIKAQTYDASMNEFGVQESQLKARSTEHWGFENYRLEGSYSQLVKYYLDLCEMVEKRLNWQVKEIIWKGVRSEDDKSGNKRMQTVTIKNQHGETIEPKYVIITVPLTVLKYGDIQFVPSLPPNKQIAISRIHMGGALKIVCRVKKQFWPESIRVVFSVRGFISQIWFYSREPVSLAAKRRGEKCHVVSGFATAEWADKIGEMEEAEVAKRFLQQLDEIFGSEGDPTPASINLVNYVYYHWNKNPYIRGGYSSPTAHACGSREELARPLDDCVFFAGEAANMKVSATVQSAIETGMRAAGEVCRAAGRKIVAKL